MPGFLLVPRALRDVADILSYLHRESGARAANEAEKRLFQSFKDLVQMPALGRRRPELTSKNVIFHVVRPYVIVFRRVADRVRVLRVVHGARDLQTLL